MRDHWLDSLLYAMANDPFGDLFEGMDLAGVSPASPLLPASQRKTEEMPVVPHAAPGAPFVLHQLTYPQLAYPQWRDKVAAHLQRCYVCDAVEACLSEELPDGRRAPPLCKTCRKAESP